MDSNLMVIITPASQLGRSRDFGCPSARARGAALLAERSPQVAALRSGVMNSVALVAAGAEYAQVKSAVVGGLSYGRQGIAGLPTVGGAVVKPTHDHNQHSGTDWSPPV